VLPSSSDVIVIGAGNAALCAALAAAEHGASVLVLERSAEEESGGTGLMAGAVFGKIAGDSAGKQATARVEAKAAGRNW
jgi:succinate dehydrogenase/fumarate reductase flavoprotein subunit